MFTFRNSSVLFCPEEGNDKFYLAVVLRTRLQTPEEAVGTICTNTVLLEFISTEKVTQGAQGVCPMTPAYVLIDCIPEPPLHRGQEVNESPFIPTALISSGLYQLQACAWRYLSCTNTQ